MKMQVVKFTKSFTAIVAVSAGLLLGAQVSASAQTIVDSSFETPNVGTGLLGFQPSPSGSGWTFAGNTIGSAGISGNNSSFTAGNPNAPDGIQVAYIQRDGSFSQNITLAASGSYQVSFLAAQRGTGAIPGPNPGQQVVSISLGTTQLGTFLPSSTNYATFTTTAAFFNAGTYTLTFAGLNTVADNTALIDKVQLLSGVGTAAPEPGSASLAILGLVPVAFGLIRRRRASHA